MNSNMSGAGDGTRMISRLALESGGALRSSAATIADEKISLGTITGFVAASSAYPSAASRQSRAERYELQNIARSLLGSSHRIAGCLRYRRWGGSNVEVRNRQETGLAYYSGLQICGLSAVCPCCGARVAEHRANEADQAITEWKSRGGVVALITLTFAHSKEDTLKDNLDALLKVYRHMLASRAYRRLKSRYNLCHFIKATEMTWSKYAGWHPHIHLLGFFADSFDAVAFESELWKLWAAELALAGRVCHRVHGLKVQQGFANAHKYVSKVGRLWGLADEVARSNQKRARTISQKVPRYSPPDLLRAVRDEALPNASSLFCEYVDVVKGRHLFQWSTGLRAAVGLAVEKSEEEIAQGVDQLDLVLASINAEEWLAVRRAKGRLRLLEIADGGDIDAVWRFIDSCVTQLHRCTGTNLLLDSYLAG